MSINPPTCPNKVETQKKSGIIFAYVLVGDIVVQNVSPEVANWPVGPLFGGSLNDNGAHDHSETLTVTPADYTLPTDSVYAPSRILKDNTNS